MAKTIFPNGVTINNEDMERRQELADSPPEDVARAMADLTLTQQAMLDTLAGLPKQELPEFNSQPAAATSRRSRQGL